MLMEESSNLKLGGPGKTGQVDKSKIGKREYHRGIMLRVSGCLEELKKDRGGVSLFKLRRGQKLNYCR